MKKFNPKTSNPKNPGSDKIQCLNINNSHDKRTTD